jgi:hypothetical protein
MAGLTDNFAIQLGLSQLPSDDLPPQLYNSFYQLHVAIFNLLRGVSQYSGIDAPDPSLWPQLAYSDTLLTGNSTRMYPIASVAISRGQAVNLFNNAGVLNARLAVATSATTMMHGVANSTAAPGDRVEINWMRGLIDSIGGMTLGTLYYLSTVAGAVQSGRPVGAGQIIQSAGFALTTDQMLLDCSLQYIQL